MRKSQTYGGNFLKSESLETGNGQHKTMVLTLTGDIETTKFDDGKEQRVIGFKETEQRLGLNATNWDSIAEISGKDDDEQWVGTVIEVYFDKNVSFGGKKIGGIRIRKPGGALENTPPPPATKVGAWAWWIRKRGNDTAKWLPEWTKALGEVEAASGVAKTVFAEPEWQMLMSMAEPMPLPPGGVVIDEASIPF